MDAPEAAGNSPAPTLADARALNPVYEAFVYGDEESLPLAIPQWAVLLMLALLVCGLVLMALPFFQRSQWTDLHDHGVRVQATMTRFGTTTSGHTTTHYAYYTYTAPNPLGTPQAYEGRIAWPNDYGPAAGTTLPVLYLPSEPEESMDAEQRAPDLFGGLLLFLLGALFAGLAGWVLAAMLWTWLWLRWLAHDGQLLAGTIAAVDTGKWVRGRNRSWYSAPLTVEFASPATGQRIQTLRTVSFDAQSEVPAVGAGVPVLYRSDTQYTVL